ncbi:MAG: peptidoglycan DD-metalloendopeptidase family protein [Desulfovibrio sp.]|jgi:Rod binding domain-containing protein/murein DD-endopeptidase MepM/ murein hydrolase activator NlpD|nr:peptidoglycan DD-metalloendopeptidase family protein [Desulfovibrio sp.]
MMNPASDPAARKAAQDELVRRRLDMDALRERLAPGKSKNVKLREACEGFEAVFLQKMWEQMRKTVPKEGFLHSKDEETYQSLFDVELCKKMASAGGIGLADMLYEQLAQQLENSGRTTTPGRYRKPLDIPASSGLLAAKPEVRASAGGREPTAEELYDPVAAEPEKQEEGTKESALEAALGSLRLEIGSPAVREWAKDRELATGSAGEAAALDNLLAQALPNGPEPPAGAGGLGPSAGTGSLGPSAGTGGSGPSTGAAEPKAAEIPGITASVDTGSAFAPYPVYPPEKTGTDGAKKPGSGAEETAKPEIPDTEKSAGGKPSDLAAASWKSPGPVFAKPRPIGKFTRARNSGKNPSSRPAKSAGPKAADAPSPAGDQAPPAQNARASSAPVWPVDGPLLNRFGWTDPPEGGRRWNPGVEIASVPGAPVRAVLPGTVVYAGPREGKGNTVVLEHKDGYRSYYGNLQQTNLRVGERVGHGAEFARVAAGSSASPQEENSASLFFELKKGEMAVNPESAVGRAM